MTTEEIILEVESWKKVFKFLKENANEIADRNREEGDTQNALNFEGNAGCYDDALKAFESLLKKIKEESE